MLCVLIPGIVYILLAGKRESLVVNIDSAMAGMTVVQVTFKRVLREGRRA